MDRVAPVNLDDGAMAGAETIRLCLDWGLVRGRGEGEEWRWDSMAANLRSFTVSGASQELVG